MECFTCALKISQWARLEKSSPHPKGTAFLTTQTTGGLTWLLGAIIHLVENLKMETFCLKRHRHAHHLDTTLLGLLTAHLLHPCYQRTNRQLDPPSLGNFIPYAKLFKRTAL